MSKTKRLDLELTPDVWRRIGVLKQLAELDSEIEVLRRALGLYDLVIRQGENGAVPYLEFPDGRRSQIILEPKGEVL